MCVCHIIGKQTLLHPIMQIRQIYSYQICCVKYKTRRRWVRASSWPSWKKENTYEGNHKTISRLENKSVKRVSVSPRVATNGLFNKSSTDEEPVFHFDGLLFHEEKRSNNKKEKEQNPTKLFESSPKKKIFEKLTWFSLSLSEVVCCWLVGCCLKCRRVLALDCSQSPEYFLSL